ncbi:MULTISPECIES: type II secretion system protein [Thermosipho]|uniref:Type IV pilin n=1 Tax=Thermosipho affectus TaxID=660294 RepID=A0ABX3II50_9BACT|nr:MULTISPECIES: type II secretion system protein [Thermosipho]ANQ53998.1 N-terminal cleavage protein [Thermosipho sp. 1070]APT72443.1 type IV pilin [Thermosipho sp. 1063]MBT1248139.1 type IV pilin [Thermosipho sp. 1244]ONN27008.1 type IV pilin [Thermosipho affectus]OOC42782.1 type IV pilin [Thermosipho sp. 1074]
MKKGFTLIELLIVLAVISALLSVATPLALRSVAKAKATQVAMNLRALLTSIEQAILLYPDEFNVQELDGQDIVLKLYEKGFINTNLSVKGYKIDIDKPNNKFVIKYTGKDIDLTLVKSSYPAVKTGVENGEEYVYVEVNIP